MTDTLITAAQRNRQMVSNGSLSRWRVCKRDGAWRIYDRGVWSHTYQTLTEAHTEATQNAVADTLYQPGGLTLLAEMRNAHTTLHHNWRWISQ